MPIARRRGRPDCGSRDHCSPRRCRSAAEAAEVRPLTRAYNASGQALFRDFSAGPGNIVFSPYSIGTAMAMALAGARGETEREMAAVLHHSLDRAQINDANASRDRDPERLRQERRAADLPARHAARGRALRGEAERRRRLSVSGDPEAASCAWRPRGLCRRPSSWSPMR